MLGLSDVLGYTSMICWLGAQFPYVFIRATNLLSNLPISSQVVENIRCQSCEGLALPFLANWLMGI